MNSEEDNACAAMIRASLIGSDTCTAHGMTVKSGAPVLALCRKLIEAGHDPSMPLDASRGETLCLRVRSIGEAATLRMDTDKTGRPVSKREKTTARASLVEFRREAADAILTAAGADRLTKKFIPGERDPFHGRRLTRARKNTAESIREQVERRGKIAVGLELYRRAESKLIKKEQT